jgi:hypothetical protein
LLLPPQLYHPGGCMEMPVRTLSRDYETDLRGTGT